MTLAIRQLERKRRIDSPVIDRFLQAHVFPIVEGSSVTFVYRGVADAVYLQHWIFGLPTAQPFEAIVGTDLWYLILELPAESRVEYKIEVVQNGQGTWILDPLNSRLAHDPFGANSVCYGVGYQRPDWTLPDKEAREGKLEEHSIPSKTFNQEKSFQVYVPARFRTRRRYPLLIVHDGTDYLRYAQMKTVLDNLIHRLEIPPMIVAFNQPGDRLKEYGADSSHAAMLVREALPYLEQRYPLINSPSARCLMGASFGAVASLFTAWQYPGVFDRLLIQSGSFVFTEIGTHRRGREFDPVVRFVNRFREKPGRPAEKLFVSCGTYEPLIYENRSMVPFLQRSGMNVRYVEARDGHNWENWRDRLRDGLSWLFPGPLWMIYE